MKINVLPLPNDDSQRIRFAHASPQLVAQVLRDTKQRLVHHFPAVSWFSWCDTLRELQLDVLVDGNVGIFDWPDLLRRVQGLVASLKRRALDLPTEGPGAVVELRAHRQQAVRGLAELHENPHVCRPLVYALVTQLIQDHAVSARGSGATPGAGPPPANQPGPLGLELPFPSSGPLVGEKVRWWRSPRRWENAR